MGLEEKACLVQVEQEEMVQMARTLVLSGCWLEVRLAIMLRTLSNMMVVMEEQEARREFPILLPQQQHPYFLVVSSTVPQADVFLLLLR